MSHDLTSECRWVGPFQLRSLLENCMNPIQAWPEERAGIYLVSLRPWTGEPTADCKALYVGTNTKNPERFLQRVGELVKDMLGFFGDYAGNHSGGWKVYRYCERNGLHPWDLFVGWADVSCGRCSENSYYDLLEPELNGVRPSYCSLHA